jgi:hypothetical protein
LPHPEEGEHALESLVLEVPIEQIAHGEQRELIEECLFTCRFEGGQDLRALWGRGEQVRGDQPGETLQPHSEVEEGLGVVSVELLDLAKRAVGFLPHRERGAVAEQGERQRIALIQVQPEPFQFELLDDLRPQ